MSEARSERAGGRRQRLWSKRPHLDRSQHKFSFEVLVRSLQLKPHLQCDRMSVLWTRGSKAAHTREVAVVDGCALVEEKLCLLCTLFRDDKRQSFDRKLCTFTIVQRSGIKLGRASIDLSNFASLEPSAACAHAVDVLRGGIVVGALSLEISSRWLRDYLRQAGAAADDASSLCSDSACSEADDCEHTDDGDNEWQPSGRSRAGSYDPSDGETDGAASGSATTPARRCELASRGVSMYRERSGASDVSSAARADQRLQAELADERATRRELEAELAAQADSIRRRATGRSREAADDEGARAEVQALREQLAEKDAQHVAAEERWRLELKAVRREKESALAELRQLAAEREAALSVQLASVEETYGERLARAQEQTQTVSRRLGKASKSSESARAQLLAENSLLEARADALENELCEALDARRRQTEQVSALTRRVGELEQQLADRPAAARSAGARARASGAEIAEELREELSVSRSVRDSLRADIAQLEGELVAAKLTRAQDDDEKMQLRRQLRASRARQLALAERMTELEVRLAEAFDEGALAEERIAEAFSSVIKELEGQLAQRQAGSTSSSQRK